MTISVIYDTKIPFYIFCDIDIIKNFIKLITNANTFSITTVVLICVLLLTKSVKNAIHELITKVMTKKIISKTNINDNKCGCK